MGMGGESVLDAFYGFQKSFHVGREDVADITDPEGIGV